jgi:hypothetical protein
MTPATDFGVLAAIVLAFATLALGCSAQDCPTAGASTQTICSLSGTGSLSTSPDLGLGSTVFAISGHSCLSAGTCSVRPTVTLSNRETGNDLPILLATITLPVHATGMFGFGGSGAASPCDPADPACVDVTGSLMLYPMPATALTATTGGVDVLASTLSLFDATFSVVLQTPDGQEISIDNAHVTLSACGGAGLHCE